MMIRFRVTGGTFDKEQDELSGALFFKDKHVREMRRLGRCNLDLEFRRLMMIDSTEMSEVGREMILKSCAEANRERIVFSRGTDTMSETARCPGARVNDKTVVIMGAMVPYTLGSSDGALREDEGQVTPRIEGQAAGRADPAARP